LLSAVGVVELALGFGAAGWSHRAGAAVIALIGAVLLVRGIAAIVAAVVAIFKRRRGKDLDEDEWQELPPPSGG
jgi:uncharacterized membrane protein HdeD (DUF308 family)